MRQKPKIASSGTLQDVQASAVLIWQETMGTYSGAMYAGLRLGNSNAGTCERRQTNSFPEVNHCNLGSSTH